MREDARDGEHAIVRLQKMLTGEFKSFKALRKKQATECKRGGETGRAHTDTREHTHKLCPAVRRNAVGHES